jgi:hypothetical protein
LTTKSDVFAFGVFLNDLIFPPVLVGVVPASKKFAFIFRTKTPMTKPDWCGVDNRQTELLNQVSYLKEVSDDKTQKIRSKITMKMTVAATLVNVLEQQAMVSE